MRKLYLLMLVITFTPVSLLAQELTPKWDELTAAQWDEAMAQADSTCILPLGILEKHGPHLPMGSDIITSRGIALEAARQEYAVVFPEFYFGQIYEAKHLPGTIALPSDLVWDILQATVDEIGRNGFKKIILVNGHGGNNSLLPYFVQSQLESTKGYVVYLFRPEADPEVEEKIDNMRKSERTYDMHAGEGESSMIMHLRPDLVDPEVAKTESGKDLARLDLPESLYTGIWWHARFPNHYAGQGNVASAELGKVMVEDRVKALKEAIRAVKGDQKTPAIQKDYFEQVESLDN